MSPSSRQYFCPITGLPLSLAEAVVEVLPGRFADSRFLFGVDLDAEKKCYARAVARLEKKEERLAWLEAEIAYEEQYIQDIEYRLGLLKETPPGYRDRWEQERRRRCRVRR